MPKKPLLSICIPTYNRADILSECLKAIVNQDGFDDRVEVVISDNCSTDHTREVGMSFCGKYDNIRYFRNDENILDKNFALSLQRGTGVLRKLANDTTIFRPGAVQYMLKAAEENLKEKPQVYFLSKTEKENNPFLITDYETYINTLGINMTWIRSLALWDDDCEDLSIFSELSHTNMAQVPYLMLNFEKRGKAVVYDCAIIDMKEIKGKNLSYGIFRVFYTNFLGFIRRWVSEGKINELCFQSLRRKLLLEFFSLWVAIWETGKGGYRFSDENLKELVRDAYRKEKYYPLYLIMKLYHRFSLIHSQGKGEDR